jgi:hypothetical protein
MLVAIAEAIKLRCLSFGGRVSVSAEFALIEDAAKMTLPAAYVVMLDDNAANNSSENGYQQVIADAFGIVVVLSNAVDELGKTSIAAILPLRSELCKGLLSWMPDAEHGEIEYSGGQLLAIDRGAAYYQYEFTAPTELTEADTYQETVNSALPPFEGLNINIDAINPHDPNLAAIGPDGVIEAVLQVDLPQ